MIAAKSLAVLVIEIVQIVLLVGIARLMFGWRPSGSPLAALAALVLGSAAFAGLGLLMAGTLRAEATLAVANGLYLVFLLMGGFILPLDRLPGTDQPGRPCPARGGADRRYPRGARQQPGSGPARPVGAAGRLGGRHDGRRGRDVPA